MSIIDIKELRAKKEKEPYYKDHKGEIWYPFDGIYNHEGRNFSLTFYARSFDDAENVVQSIKQSMWVDGKIVHEELVELGTIDFDELPPSKE